MNEPPPPNSLRALLAGCALLGAAWLLTAFCYQAPAALPESAADTVFSALRALQSVQRVMAEPDGRILAHPIGSAAHERVLQRLLLELRALGFEPGLQDAWLASRNLGVCARVRNVVVEIPGRRPGKVMFLAHYDSVPAGPGAADDAAGVAVLLELARQFRGRPPPVSLLLVFSDGEEAGLLGAQLFVEEHPGAESVDVVLNFEARGSHGPSLMFQTFGPTRALLQMLRGAPRLLTNSLARTVYARLPNDTDLTVLGQAGFAGLNFAFIDGIEHYHTPLDNLEQLDPGSLQQHGDYAQSFLRGLTTADSPPWHAPAEAEPVFFDLYGQGLVVLPAAIMPWLAGSSLLALLLVTALRLKWKQLRWGALLWGNLAWPAGLALGMAAGWAVGFGLTGLGAIPGRIPWVAWPAPLMAALGGAVASGLLLSLVLLGRRAGFWGAWAGVWLPAAGLALAVAFVLPPASYVLVLPVLAAAIGGALSLARPGLRSTAALLPLGLAALLQVPLAWMLADALGMGRWSPLVPVLALLLGWLQPLASGLTRRTAVRWLLLALLLALLGGVAAWLHGPYSRAHPQRLNLVHQQWTDSEGTTVAAWRVASFGEALPQPYRELADFGAAPLRAPWLLDAGSAWQAAVPGVPGLEAPRLVDISSEALPEGRRIRARLVSARGASVCQLGWAADAGVVEVRVQGQLLRAWRNFGSHHGFVCPTMPSEGVQVELLLRDARPVELLLGDQSAGLPPAAHRLQEARPEASCPSQLGDRTVCLRAWRLD